MAEDNAADVAVRAEPSGRIARTLDAMRTVRGRSAVIASIVVGLALGVGAVVSVLSLRANLTDSLDQTLLQQAQDRAQLIDAGTSPASLANTLQEEALVWIGTPDGTAIAVGAVVVPLESPVPANLNGVGEANLLVEERKPDENEVERMTMRLAAATTADGSIVVLSGAETEVIDNASRQLIVLFAIGIPLLMFIVAAIAWASAGRALRPVEDIRRRTLDVSGTSLSERVPVPPGGDEIHDLALTMNDMLERLEQHHVALRQFTSDASHELKSPVANLRALTETAQISDPEWPGVRDRLGAETDRLRDLVDNLVFLATHDDPSAAHGQQRARVDLDDLVFAEAELLASTGRVRIDLSEVEPTSVAGDAFALTRLVRNLADNAARHASGLVLFGLAPTEHGQVRLEVLDDGPGIPADLRDRVFERFTRLDDARDRDGGGAGLGLAIVQRIVDDHHGSITIADRPGGGAKISVMLPAFAD